MARATGKTPILLAWLNSRIVGAVGSISSEAVVGWSDVIHGGLADGHVSRDKNLAPEDRNLDRQTNFLEAVKELGLTQQEKNLYRHHLDNMAAGLAVRNPDGSQSTILQVTIQGPDGRYYDVPTVWNGKILPPMEGVKRAVQSQGWGYWPSYSTSDEADARYMQYHRFMEKDMAH